MAIGGGQMEIALTPFGVAGRGRRLLARFHRAFVSGIDIIDIEDDGPPPRLALLLARRDDIEIAGAGAKAGEGR